MSVQVFQPFEIFYDINGRPLDDGFIFIGQPNLDPVTNPISVFFDEALTIPAAQPIRTRNGFPANAGVQAQVFVAETTFSISIKNKNSTVIRSVAAVHSSSDLEGRLRDSVSPLNGTNIPGWARKDLSVAVANAATIQRALEASSVCLWEFIHLITDRPDPSDMTTWDWAPAVNGCARFIADNYAQATLSFGKSMYVPALGLSPGYRLKTPVMIPRAGINIIGEGSLSSVFRVDAALAGEDYVWILRNEAPSGNMGGCCFYGIGLDMNAVDAGGISFEDGYDAVLIDDLRVSRLHADRTGFRMGPRTDGNPGMPVSQTINCRNLFVYRENTAGTVPPVMIIKVQEAQFIGGKAWAGGYGGSGQSPTSAWYIEDCRSLDMIGCSAVGASDYGIHVRSDTRSVQGIRIRGQLYENCTGRLKTTSSATSATRPINGLIHERARTEAPISGDFSLTAMTGSIVDLGVASAVMSDTSTNEIHALRQSNVSGKSSTDIVLSNPNAIDDFWGFSENTRVIMDNTPRYTYGRPDTTDFAYIEWSSSSVVDNGVRVGINRGSNDTLASWVDVLGSNQTSMLLLVNDGATTTVRRVTIGVADSGGVGFRVLRVPNA